MGTHSPGYYHSEAGLVILTHDDGSFEAYTGAGARRDRARWCRRA